MKQSIHYSLLTAGTLAFCTFGGLADAQEPGTNVATPPPVAPTLADPGTPLTTSAVASPIAASNEPVIDTATTRKTLPNRPLLITGLVTLGGTYGASAIVAATSEREADDKLFYPVVGPWMDLADRGCDANPCENETLNKVLLIGDGVLQGLGALSIVLSVMIPESKTRSWYLIGDSDVVIAPQLGSRMTGLAAAGRF